MDLTDKKRRRTKRKLTADGARAIRLITQDVNKQDKYLESQKIRGRIPGLRTVVDHTFKGEVTPDKVDALVEWCIHGALRSYAIRAATKVQATSEAQAETDRLLEQISEEDLDTVPPITRKVRDGYT